VNERAATDLEKAIRKQSPTGYKLPTERKGRRGHANRKAVAGAANAAAPVRALKVNEKEKIK
jgi:hypothetical protein